MSFIKYSRPNPMHLYEMNYFALMQLVPELGDDFEDMPLNSPLKTDNNNFSYNFDMAGANLTVRLLEVNRYTHHIQVINDFKSSNKFLPSLCLNVRAYHDVSVTEVISCSGIAKLLPDYTYPNEKMLLKDEKQQANRLLYEWLSSARTYYRFEPVSI
jgi:uncharacterized protein YqiB (DUF1249 family)